MEIVKENIISVTPDNFKTEVLESDRPVLVTFYAAWDQPCRMQQPALDSIADKHPEIICPAVRDHDDPHHHCFQRGKKGEAGYGTAAGKRIVEYGELKGIY